MQITLTFDSMEEFLRYVDVRGKINTTFTDFSPAEIQETLTRRLDAAARDRGTGTIVGATPEEQRQEEAREAAQAAAVPEKKPKSKKNPPKEEKPAEEPTAAQEEASAAKSEEDLEKLRLKARKILFELNEATGTNTARQLIKKRGAENLKMLPAEKLPELIKMAEEDLADAQ